jgi:hypothetical protein
VENRTVRRFVDAAESGVDFRSVVDNGEIVLVDVKEGAVGSLVSRLVGSVVVTKVWAAVQSRITLPKGRRHPFYLYVDEVQKYAGEASSFSDILGMGREYGLGCWLATQYLNKMDTEMRRAVANNCRTKVVFDPTGSEDLTQIVQMLRGVSKSSLKGLGDYSAVVKTPSLRDRETAVVVDTYLPWDADFNDVDLVKEHGVRTGSDGGSVGGSVSVGSGGNAGGDRHAALLDAAKQYLNSEGWDVDVLYQVPGEDKPDGVAINEDGVWHVEAEVSTLSKPDRVAENFRRAAAEDRGVVFVVESGCRDDLRGILDEVDVDTRFRVLEVTRFDEVMEPGGGEDVECPELEAPARTEGDLVSYCLYRSDGYCELLESGCVVGDEP